MEGFKRVLDSSTSALSVKSGAYKRMEFGNVALTQEGASTAALLHGIGTSTTRAKTGTANKNFLGSGTYRGCGVVFGADAVAEAVAVAEELRADPPTDMGRSKSIGWYFLGGWKLVWANSIQGHARIVRIASL